ncbi:hypothetical protein ACWD5B_33970 [Streptomyces tanashiensis]
MRAEAVAPPEADTAPRPHSGAAGAPAAPARAGSSSRFAVALRAALDEIGAASGDTVGPVPAVTVAALGVRDAYTDTADGRGPRHDSAAAGRPVPVHLYGRQVIVGPWPAAPGATERADRAGCAICLRRRWQGVRLSFPFRLRVPATC